MASHQSSHIFSQGGELSQLGLSGFPVEKDLESNEEQVHNLPATDDPQRAGETISSRAEAICEENRQINRYVELSLKQLEKKRIKLINKEKAMIEKKAKLLEIHQRQTEQNIELQMSIEEWSTKYANELKERKRVVEKLKQVEDFINKYEQNLAMGVAVGESIGESKKLFESEIENIKKKSKCTRENLTRMKVSITAELEEKANKCKTLRDTMMMDRENMISEIQALAFQSEEKLTRINSLQKEISKAHENKENLTQLHNSILKDHEALNGDIAKMYQELNETKTINASRIQHLKLQMNIEGNIKTNLDTKLKEKEEVMHNLTTKLKESTNLSNQIRDAVDEIEKRVEKKVKEIELYRNKKPVLKDQVHSLVNTLKKYKNVENENRSYKENIALLEAEVKLGIDTLAKKENILLDLKKEAKGLEKKLSDFEENKLELERKLEDLQIKEHKLSCTIKEDKIIHQNDREERLKQNETLTKTNEELESKIAECTLKLEELYSFNDNAVKEEDEINTLIDSYKETVRVNEEKILVEKEEQMKLVENFNDNISELTNYLERNEYFVQEAKPKQKELAIMLEKKESLEHEIKLLTENHEKKINTLQNIHRAKIQEMDNEMEKHSSIMKNIQSDQEESTKTLKAEIKEVEEVKSKLENELRVLHQKLKGLKNEELKKRNKIVRMEKRQQKIMNEIKVTREDIAQSVTGKTQFAQETEQVAAKRARLATPVSSAGSSHSLHSRRAEENKTRPDIPIFAGRDSKQESTRKWIESVPEDDYDFSEV